MRLCVKDVDDVDGLDQEEAEDFEQIMVVVKVSQQCILGEEDIDDYYVEPPHAEHHIVEECLLRICSDLLVKC